MITYRDFEDYQTLVDAWRSGVFSCQVLSRRLTPKVVQSAWFLYRVILQQKGKIYPKEIAEYLKWNPRYVIHLLLMLELLQIVEREKDSEEKIYFQIFGESAKNAKP